MVALGALSARPAAPALARTARRPPSAARASFSRAASKREGFALAFRASPTTASTREVASSRARPPRRPLASRRSSTDATPVAAVGPGGARARALALGGDADADGADAGEEELLHPERRTRAAPSRAGHRFLTRTTFVGGGDGGAVQRLDAVRVNDQGVSFATATAKRLACVFLSARREQRRRQSRGGGVETLGARLGVAVRAFSCSVRDWPRRSSCMSRRRTSRFCGFSRRWTVKARGIQTIWKRRIRQPPPPSETRRCA